MPSAAPTPYPHRPRGRPAQPNRNPPRASRASGYAGPADPWTPTTEHRKPDPAAPRDGWRTNSAPTQSQRRPAVSERRRGPPAVLAPGGGRQRHNHRPHRQRVSLLHQVKPPARGPAQRLAHQPDRAAVQTQLREHVVSDVGSAGPGSPHRLETDAFRTQRHLQVGSYNVVSSQVLFGLKLVD